MTKTTVTIITLALGCAMGAAQAAASATGMSTMSRPDACADAKRNASRDAGLSGEKVVSFSDCNCEGKKSEYTGTTSWTCEVEARTEKK